MAGNSKRRGAIRKDGTKKDRSPVPVASVGAVWKGAAPPPKAVDRPYHAAHKKAAANAKRTAGRPNTRRREDGPEYVVGRNPVLECLRAGVPATALYVAVNSDPDDRVSESVGLAADKGIAILEATKPELDRIASNGLHQGVALQVPEYRYTHPDDLMAQAQASGTAAAGGLDNITDPATWVR